MSQDETTTERLDSKSTRRSFVKKGALASSAVALGLTSSGAVSAQQSPETGLVFADDYEAGTAWQIAGELRQPTVNSVLDGAVSDATD